MKRNTHMVTGAFGYSGMYIAKRLLEKGHTVHTLTNTVNRQDDFGDKVKAFPFNFDNPRKLAESLRGVSVLYNTYWVRFNHKTFSHVQAVENTKRLFRAAAEAGVERIVHTSITNPDAKSPYEYFRGKAILEKVLMETGISYAILRPAVLFGRSDILINNIAWVLRRFPVFFVFGDGSYGIQPIHVEDFAALAAEQGGKRDNCVINAVGPERFTYRDLAAEIGSIIGKKRPLISVNPTLGYMAASIIGFFLGDVFLTREEIGALMADTLSADTNPVGTRKLTDWLRENRESIGNNYANELARRKLREGK